MNFGRTLSWMNSSSRSTRAISAIRLDESLATLRAAANDYDRHTFDCMEVDIALQRRQFDEAFRGIDELVARPLHQTHGARPLSRGLVNIHRTLEKMIAASIGPVEEMRLKSSRVVTRAEELHQQIINQGDDQFS
jgi:hypothetical protein